jgi:hypothetical protein
MADRMGPRLTDAELEATLRDAGAHLAYPAAADLLPAVRARLEQRRGGFAQLLWSPRYALVPAVVTLVILALATLAFTPIGAQAAEALGLRGLRIFQTAQTPPPLPPRPSPSASATASVPPGGVLFDAVRVASVDAASRQAGFTVIVPSALGSPDEVYTRVTSQDSQVFLVYRPRAATAAAPALPESSQTGVGLLVTEVRGSFEIGLLGKLLGPGSRPEQLTVNGVPGVWIEGAPHQFFYRQPNGTFVQDTLRLAGNVLIWNSGDLLIRLEAEIPKDAALQIAGTMR